jgi:hypothetical protein
MGEHRHAFTSEMIRSRLVGNSNLKMVQTHQANIKRTLPLMMRAAGRLICVSLATSTAPYGTSANARRMGENALLRDILRVYGTPARVAKTFPNKGTAEVFLFHMANRRFAQAQGIVDKFSRSFRGVPILPFDGGKAHQAARKRGRILAGQRPAMIVQTTRNLNAYGRAELQHVGKAKGGWVGGATALGGSRGLPAWITRHSSGGAYENYTGNTFRIHIENNVPYITDALDRGDKETAIDIGINRYLKGGGVLRRAAHGEPPV